MDPTDAFPEHISTTAVPVTLPKKPNALEYAARQDRAGSIYTKQRPTQNVCLSCFVKTIGIKKDAFGQFQACREGGKACQRI
ncbi:hypothetical protein TNCV_4752061 [Trichonephila clavipes]|nr:hypothetical protein TNCV_4752061 [Trichonephila clavipes]